LRQALRPVEHAPTDAQAGQLNAIRRTLRSFGGMRGVGLPQPHPSRTSLCDLPPDQLAAEYRAGMQTVRDWVGSVAQRGRRQAPAAEAVAEAEGEAEAVAQRPAR